MDRKLYRIEEGKMLCGVCGGIAEYFGVDPTVIRLAWVLFSALGGSGLLAYLICAIIIPMQVTGPVISGAPGAKLPGALWRENGAALGRGPLLLSHGGQQGLDPLHKGGAVHIQDHEGVLLRELEVAPEVRHHLAEGVLAPGLHVDPGLLAGEHLRVHQVQNRADIVQGTGPARPFPGGTGGSWPWPGRRSGPRHCRSS